MIALAWDCLMFRLGTGESIPYSAEMIAVEVCGEPGRWLEADMVQQAAKAVLHYFKHDEQRESITMGEFALALEKVLKGMKFGVEAAEAESGPGKAGVAESDLRRLARASGRGCELFFFPLLRKELQEQLRGGPSVLRFRGLRSCVKQLTGARRWCGKCQDLQQQIVGFLRECLSAEERGRVDGFALVVT